MSATELDRVRDRLDSTIERVARVETRVDNHAKQLESLRGVADTVTRLDERSETMNQAIVKFAAEAKADRESYAAALQERDEQHAAQQEARDKQAVQDRRDRRQTRQWLIGVAVTALLGLAGLYIEVVLQAAHTVHP